MNIDQSQWPNFIYLALLLLMLITSLSIRNIKFKKVLKYSAAWLGVAIFFIALYSYRFEFADLKSRILGEINPTSAQVNKSGEITINLAKDGHFYLRVKINQIPILFMVDTGASDVVISRKEAQKIGINIDKLNFNRRYQTANGVSFGAGAVADEIEFAGIKFNNVPISVNSADMGTSLLGMSFLRKFKKYEFYRDKLILTL